MEECVLYERDPEFGDVYINSGPAARMIEGAETLAGQYPRCRYIVKRGGVVIWPAEQKSAPGIAGDTHQNG